MVFLWTSFFPCKWILSASATLEVQLFCHPVLMDWKLIVFPAMPPPESSKNSKRSTNISMAILAILFSQLETWCCNFILTFPSYCCFSGWITESALQKQHLPSVNESKGWFRKSGTANQKKTPPNSWKCLTTEALTSQGIILPKFQWNEWQLLKQVALLHRRLCIVRGPCRVSPHASWFGSNEHINM